MADLTEAMEEALLTAPTDITTHNCIVLRLSSAEVHRFVDGTQDLTLNGFQYKAAELNWKLANQEAGGNPTFQFNVYLNDPLLINRIDTVIESLNPITVEFESFLSTQVARQAEFRSPLEVVDISMAENDQLIVSASFPDVNAMPFPATKYTTTNHPGLR